MTGDVTELENLVSEMLHYARLDAQSPSLESHLVDLNELMESLVDKLNFDSAIAISVIYEQPNLYRCDPHFISRAFQNILGNAIKHAHSRIEVRLQASEEQCIISVEDDGEGIPDSKRADIFKPFIRLDKSRDKRTGGYDWFGYMWQNCSLAPRRDQCRRQSTGWGTLYHHITVYQRQNPWLRLAKYRPCLTRLAVLSQQERRQIPPSAVNPSPCFA